nr:DUF3613 domain-containing protein [uncultured Vibrio sp.]
MIRLILGTLLFSTNVTSATYESIKPNQTVRKQDTTSTWLLIQKKNLQATQYEDKLTPEQAKAAQDRVENSFKYPLPDSFIDTEFGE